MLWEGPSECFVQQEETLVLQEKEGKISRLEEQLQVKAEAEEKLERQKQVWSWRGGALSCVEVIVGVCLVSVGV